MQVLNLPGARFFMNMSGERYFDERSSGQFAVNFPQVRAESRHYREALHQAKWRPFQCQNCRKQNHIFVVLTALYTGKSNSYFSNIIV